MPSVRRSGPGDHPDRPSRRSRPPRTGAREGRAPATPRQSPRRPARSGGAGRDERSRGAGSDLGARILIAVPAAIIAIIFVDLGGLAFALFMIAVGAVCMYELYRMLARWRPAPAVGFAALAAMVIAARYGTERDVLEIAVAALPVAFLVVIARGQPRASTVSIAGTLLGVYWIGFAFAHAELLREISNGKGDHHRRPGGHFPGRHRRLPGRPAVRSPPAGADDLPPQDG